MLNMVSKSSLSESGKLPKVSSGVSRNLTELEKRISKFISSTERAPAQKEEVKVKVEVEVCRQAGSITFIRNHINHKPIEAHSHSIYSGRALSTHILDGTHMVEVMNVRVPTHLGIGAVWQFFFDIRAHVDMFLGHHTLAVGDFNFSDISLEGAQKSEHGMTSDTISFHNKNLGFGLQPLAASEI